MAIRKIVTEGDPVLRTRTREIDTSELKGGGLATLVDDMIETMRSAQGVGLAAPQIGEGIRLFVAETPDGPIALANAEIVKRSRKTVRDEEGCLSIPGKFDRVTRAKSVTIRARMISGEPIEFTAHDFFARVIQHEIDHLDGILFVDRLNGPEK
ncbi:hypothetical protein AMJ57_02370 [Parcubacteria bacterium SG8_24]|nr:MAG: hypothetical protein AMJ57_02370 [Parcubacteria bacterium SG8_24]